MKKIKILFLGLFFAVLLGCSSYDSADDFILKNNDLVSLYNETIDKLDYSKKDGMSDEEFVEFETKYDEYYKAIEELNLEKDNEKIKDELLEMYKGDIEILKEINKAVKKQSVDKYNSAIEEYNKNMNQENKLSQEIK